MSDLATALRSLSTGSLYSIVDELEDAGQNAGADEVRDVIDAKLNLGRFQLCGFPLCGNDSIMEVHATDGTVRRGCTETEHAIWALGPEDREEADCPA